MREAFLWSHELKGSTNSSFLDFFELEGLGCLKCICFDRRLNMGLVFFSISLFPDQVRGAWIQGEVLC